MMTDSNTIKQNALPHSEAAHSAIQPAVFLQHDRPITVFPDILPMSGLTL